MRDKLLWLILLYTKWRYKRKDMDLIDPRYVDALMSYIEVSQVTKRYKPTLGMRTFISFDHRNAERLLDQFSTMLELMKRSEYIYPAAYESRVISLDDWLIDHKSRPYNLDQYLNLILSYYKVYRNLLNRLPQQNQPEQFDYYRRKMNGCLKDLTMLLETILEITH